MQSSTAAIPSPLFQFSPSTPTRQRASSSRQQTPSSGRSYTSQPFDSSPLASPRTPQRSTPRAGSSSFTAETQARRRASYKARSSFLTPFEPATGPGRVKSFGWKTAPSQAGTGGSERDFLREQFKQKCLERAARAREKAIKVKRRMSLSSEPEYGSDGEMDDEDDDDIMQDELFQRLMVNVSQKIKYGYKVSYALEVGSSFDPNMHDPIALEAELAGRTPTIRELPNETELAPAELDDEELEAYAEEYARQKAIAEFDDIPEDELFGEWSDFEDDLGPVGDESQQQTPKGKSASGSGVTKAGGEVMDMEM